MNVKYCSTGVEQVLADYFECRDLLLEALAHGDGRVNEALLVAGLVRGDYQLWRTPNSAGVTQVVSNPFNKSLFVFLSAGDLDEVLFACANDVEQWAKAQGCTAMMLSGRKGWERALRPLGYAFSSTNLIKQIAS